MTQSCPPNSGSETLYSVQYLRAAAALAVVFFHISVLSQETWGLDPARIDQVGAAGVDLFFVISGFVMAMIVARPGAFDGRQFWVRRVARVVPAYWVITAVVFMLAWSLPSLFNSTTASLHNLAASLTFLAIDQGDGSTVPLLVVGWTLNYEMFFYVIVAATAGLFGDRRLLGASAVLVGLVVAGAWLQPQNLSLAFYTDPILIEFVFGILIYRLWIAGRSGVPGFVPVLVFVFGLSLLIAQWERPVVDLRAVYWGVPAAAVLYGALGTLVLRNSLLSRLGDWSYALYLTHVFIVTFYIKYAISWNTVIELPWQVHYLIMTIVCFAVAGLFYRLVERPLSRWLLAKLRRRNSAAAPMAGAAE